MSVIAATSLYVEKVVFEYTNGTPPMAGVDIEPDENFQLLQNLSFVDCISRGNSGQGFQLYLGQLAKAEKNISICFDNCVVESGEAGGLYVGNLPQPGPGGQISFNKCMVANTKGPAVTVRDKAPQVAIARFFGSTFGPNTALGSKSAPPISLHSSHVSLFGNIHFPECKVIDDVNRPYFNAEGIVGATVEDVTGYFHVTNPYGCDTALGPQNASFTVITESCQK